MRPWDVLSFSGTVAAGPAAWFYPGDNHPTLPIRAIGSLGGYALGSAASWVGRNIRILPDNHGESPGLKTLWLLYRAGILKPENRDALVSHPEHVQKLSDAIALLHQHNMLTQRNFDTLVSGAEYAEQLSDALVLLHQNGILNPENCEALVSYAKHAQALGETLVFLHEKDALTDEVREVLVECAKHAKPSSWGLGFAIALLHRNDIFMENREALTSHPEHPREVALGLVLLHQNGILEDNRKDLLLHPKYAQELGSALAKLHQHNILTENREALVLHPEHAAVLSDILVLLHQNGILGDETRKPLVSHPEHVHKLSQAIVFLRQHNILMPENLKVLASHPEHAQELSDAFYKLHQAQILTDENRQALLLGKGVHLRIFLDKVKSLNPGGLDQAEFDKIMKSAWEKAHECAIELGRLNAQKDPTERLSPELIAMIAVQLMPNYLSDPKPPYDLGRAYATARLAEETERALMTRKTTEQQFDGTRST